MPSVLLRGGQRLVQVHSARDCRGDRCPIHKVSNHPYRKWKQNWNGSYMERVSPDGTYVIRDPDDQPFNAVDCLICGDQIESFYTHDFKTCSCGNVSVDGGRSYPRRVFRTHKWREVQ